LDISLCEAGDRQFKLVGGGLRCHVMIHVPTFRKMVQAFRILWWKGGGGVYLVRKTQQGDLVSLCLFFQSKENGLKNL
jgi:hypothetical protein